jgi:HEAT repeat protein
MCGSQTLKSETRMLETNESKQLATCEAALAMAKKQREDALRVLIGLSRDGSAAVRRRAAECLTELGGTQATAALAQLLDDANGEVRATAALALARLRVHTIRPVLIRRLENDDNVMVQIAAARALGLLGDVSGLELLMKLLEGDNERMRRIAVVALQDVIGQRFSPDQTGIQEALRYLHLRGSKLLAGVRK